MITIGVDFHKHTSSFKVLDENGNKVKVRKIQNNPDDLRSFIKELPGTKRLGVEAGRNWGLLHDCIKDLIDDYQLGHPKKMKAITSSETKNDKKDADMIAKLTYSGFMPKAHISSKDTRQLRSLLRFRRFLVIQRTSIRNQVQILIDRNLWPCQRPRSFKDPFCKRGRKWLEEVELPPRERFILNQCLKEFDEKTLKVQEIEVFLKSQCIDLPGLSYLKTVPGFKSAGVNALTVLVETDGISRFNKSRGFSHYVGLIPREHSSADKHRTGKLVKGANMHLRTAFLESALAAIRADKGLESYYRSVKIRAGSGAAIVATARKLSCAVYYCLKENRAYRPHQFSSSPVVALSQPATSSRVRYLLKK
jgi:transposase